MLELCTRCRCRAVCTGASEEGAVPQAAPASSAPSTAGPSSAMRTTFLTFSPRRTSPPRDVWIVRRPGGRSCCADWARSSCVRLPMEPARSSRPHWCARLAAEAEACACGKPTTCGKGLGSRRASPPGGAKEKGDESAIAGKKSGWSEGAAGLGGWQRAGAPDRPTHLPSCPAMPKAWAMSDANPGHSQFDALAAGATGPVPTGKNVEAHASVCAQGCRA